MKILIVTQYFWPESFLINDLALDLQECGHEVTVLTGIPNYPEGRFYPGYDCISKRREVYRGIKIIRVPLVPRGNGSSFRLALNYLSYAVSGSILGPLLCRDKIDVIFVFQMSPVTVGVPAVVLKKLKGIPVVFWVQDLWPESLRAGGGVKSPLITNLVGLVVRWIYRGCDLILAQSKAFFSSIEKYGGKRSQIRFFPNSAKEFFKPVEVAADAPERQQLPTGFRLMFAGNIAVAQDFGTIIAAAEKIRSHRDIHWVILGDGRIRPWVEEQVRARGLMETVHLLGRHPASAMPRYFALADALLVTLKTDSIFFLTIPSKLQSYFACAKPVIAALDGEGAQIIRESGAGLTCPTENPELLAETVLAMYHLPHEEREAMGRRGRAAFEKDFERNMLMNKLNNWLKDIQKGAE